MQTVSRVSSTLSQVSNHAAQDQSHPCQTLPSPPASGCKAQALQVEHRQGWCSPCSSCMGSLGKWRSQCAQPQSSFLSQHQLDPQWRLQGVYKQMVELMRSLGVESAPGEGAAFDPNVHEAIMREEDDSVEDGTILQVLRRGFLADGQLLRAAMVKVRAPQCWTGAGLEVEWDWVIWSRSAASCCLGAGGAWGLA